MRLVNDGNDKDTRTAGTRYRVTLSVEATDRKRLDAVTDMMAKQYPEYHSNCIESIDYSAKKEGWSVPFYVWNYDVEGVMDAYREAKAATK